MNILFYLFAALIKGTSVFKGVNDLANKESDRIKEMQKILYQLNIKSSYKNGEVKIFGKGPINAEKNNFCTGARRSQNMYVLFYFVYFNWCKNKN